MRFLACAWNRLRNLRVEALNPKQYQKSNIKNQNYNSTKIKNQGSKIKNFAFYILIFYLLLALSFCILIFGFCSFSINVVRGFSLVHDPEGSHYENPDGGKIKRAQNEVVKNVVRGF